MHGAYVVEGLALAVGVNSQPCFGRTKREIRRSKLAFRFSRRVHFALNVLHKSFTYLNKISHSNSITNKG